MLPTDVFLFWLAVIAAGRGNALLVSDKAAEELFDRWLCGLAGVSLKRCENGLLTRAEAKRLQHAARILDRLPVYVERRSDGFSSPYLVDPGS